MRTIASLFAVLSSMASAAAQEVWVVDAAGGTGSRFTQIQPAIDAAAPGDTVLVRSGSYMPFAVAGKSLAVVSDVGATAIARAEIRDLAADQWALLRGLTSPPGPPGSGLVGMLARDCAGPVWIEECAASGAHGQSFFSSPGFYDGAAGFRVEACASVALLRCTGTGGAGQLLEDEDIHTFAGDGGRGLVAMGSFVAVYGGAFHGGSGGSVKDTTLKPAGDGGAGALVLDGSLFASGAVFEGEVAGYHTDGGSAGQTGDGILLQSAHAVLLGGEYLTPGFGGLPIDAALGTYHVLDGVARGLKTTSPVREGEGATLRFTGQPGDLAFALYSPAQQAALPFFFFDGVILPSLAFADAAFFGVADSEGDLLVQVPIGQLPSAVEGVALYLQSLFADATLASLSLGAPSALTILDGSL